MRMSCRYFYYPGSFNANYLTLYEELYKNKPK